MRRIVQLKKWTDLYARAGKEAAERTRQEAAEVLKARE
jgi:hypothetical protein